MNNEPTVAELTGRTARLWRAVIDLELQPSGLTQPRWMALMHLHQLGGESTQKQLALSLAIKLPSIMRTLGQLESDQLIQLMKSENDKRAKIVKLTNKGSDKIQLIQESINDVQTKIMAGFSSQEEALFRDFISRINSNASEILNI